MDFKIDATLTNEYLRFSRHTSNFLRDFRCIVAISMPPNAASPASVASAGVLSEKAMRRPVDETLLRKSPSVAEALNLSVPLTSDSLIVLKVPMLKSLAQRLGLKYSGTKAQLIQRLIAYGSSLQSSSVPHSVMCSPTTNPRPRRRSKEPQANVSAKKLQLSTPRVELGHATPSAPASHNNTVSCFEAVSLPFSFHPSLHGAYSHYSCICQGVALTWPGPVVRCNRCAIDLHEKCMRWSPHQAAQRGVSFLCPKCRIETMDPFFPSDELLWMTYVHSSMPEASVMEADGSFCVLSSFSLSAERLHLWKRNNQHVVVRCVRLQTPASANAQFAHEWPRTLSLKINDHVESISAPRLDHKRRDTPMFIAQYLRPQQNAVEIMASDISPPENVDLAPCYALGFTLCRTCDVSRLTKNVQLSTTIGFEDALHRVSSLLNTSLDDDEISLVQKSHKFKLTCPITLTRMTLPARGQNCKHLQCFDLKSFIGVTKASKAFNNRWKCPECPLFVRPESLVVDSFVLRILQQTEGVPDDVVEVFPNGTWSLVHTSTGDAVLSEPRVVASSVPEKHDVLASTASVAKLEQPVGDEFSKEKRGMAPSSTDRWEVQSAISIDDSGDDKDNVLLISSSSSEKCNAVSANSASGTVSPTLQVSKGNCVPGVVPKNATKNFSALLENTETPEMSEVRRSTKCSPAVNVAASYGDASTLRGLQHYSTQTASSCGPECIDLSPSTSADEAQSNLVLQTTFEKPHSSSTPPQSTKSRSDGIQLAATARSLSHAEGTSNPSTVDSSSHVSRKKNKKRFRLTNREQSQISSNVRHVFETASHDAAPPVAFDAQHPEPALTAAFSAVCSSFDGSFTRDRGNPHNTSSYRHRESSAGSQRSSNFSRVNNGEEDEKRATPVLSTEHCDDILVQEAAQLLFSTEPWSPTIFMNDAGRIVTPSDSHTQQAKPFLSVHHQHTTSHREAPGCIGTDPSFADCVKPLSTGLASTENTQDILLPSQSPCHPATELFSFPWPPSTQQCPVQFGTPTQSPSNFNALEQSEAQGPLQSRGLSPRTAILQRTGTAEDPHTSPESFNPTSPGLDKFYRFASSSQFPYPECASRRCEGFRPLLNSSSHSPANLSSLPPPSLPNQRPLSPRPIAMTSATHYAAVPTPLLSTTYHSVTEASRSSTNTACPLLETASHTSSCSPQPMSFYNCDEQGFTFGNPPHESELIASRRVTGSSLLGKDGTYRDFRIRPTDLSHER